MSGTPDISLAGFHRRHDRKERDMHLQNFHGCLRLAGVMRRTGERRATHVWLRRAAEARGLFATWNASVRRAAKAEGRS